MKPESTALALAGLALSMPDADGKISPLFEPVSVETLADLFEQYDAERATLDRLAATVSEHPEVVAHFVAGNVTNGSTVSPAHLFDHAPAVAAMDASYWSRAMAMTDVFEAMPAARRRDWTEQCDKHKTPAFDRATVAATLQGLMAQRGQFFAERVDGIFSALSPDHITNSPTGFRKRMIVARVMDKWGHMSKSGDINDLRNVISRFMGRGEVDRLSTQAVIKHAYAERQGSWVTLDGGALRLRMYGNGNAHLEVHPELAWRLNAVLASIHPSAIPSKHRRRSARTAKHVELHARPLPFPVIRLLRCGSSDGENTFALEYGARSDPAYAQTRDVLVALGGVAPGYGARFTFDYDPGCIVHEIVTSGVVPDERAHQFYPTPETMAARVVEAADIEPGHLVLEPSAGTGAIARLVCGVAELTCVEIAELYADVLETKGFSVVCEDFMIWRPGRRFDRVVMNPPFDQGRWRAHLEHAADLCAAEARIVAVLPVGAARLNVLPGWACAWSEPIPFPGTSIEVVILTANRVAS